MTGKNCELDMKEAEGTLEVKLCGEIDHHSAVIVRTEIDARISQICPQKTVIDLSGIEFMDSSGLGLIMGRYSLIRELGGELVVRNPTAGILRICKLAGMERMISIETNKNKEKKLENETK